MKLDFPKMKYVKLNINNPECIHCFINNRAYSTVINDIISNRKNEIGGVFLGYIVNRVWYIVESVDSGINSINEPEYFKWDSDYVNYQAERLSRIYKKPLTVLGFWHRHPGSMDYFSLQDESTIAANLETLNHGLISVLVNIDPDLRMTFYHCIDDKIMKIHYDVGDGYYPKEFLQFSDEDMLKKRAAAEGVPFGIIYENVMDLDSYIDSKRKYKEDIKCKTGKFFAAGSYDDSKKNKKYFGKEEIKNTAREIIEAELKNIKDTIEKTDIAVVKKIKKLVFRLTFESRVHNIEYISETIADKIAEKLEKNIVEDETTETLMLGTTAIGDKNE